jgi:hypothetical protein
MIRTKLVRMKNGDDIIATIKQDELNTILTNPMRLVFKRLPTGQVIMMLSPWLPVELLDEEHASIENDNVLTMIEPKMQLVEYYNRTVIAFNKLKMDFESKIDEYLIDHEDEDDEEDYNEELSDEELKEIMSEVSNLKKSNKFFH